MAYDAEQTGEDIVIGDRTFDGTYADDEFELTPVLCHDRNLISIWVTLLTNLKMGVRRSTKLCMMNRLS